MIKYNLEINEAGIGNVLTKLTNQVYKLLPTREENADWATPLRGIIVQVAGMNELLIDHQSITFLLLCRLEGLLTLTEEDDFLLYRSQIFECINLIAQLKNECLQAV